MKIEVLETGSVKCKALYEVVQSAVKGRGGKAEIVKVEKFHPT